MYPRILAMAVVAAALAACASGPLVKSKDDTKIEYADYAGESIDRFTTFGLDGWSPVADNKLVVWDGVNKAYLITVWDSCRDLKFANAVSVTSTSRTVSKFEKVLVGGESCPIQEIRAIDVKQYKADRRAAAEAAKAARAAAASKPKP